MSQTAKAPRGAGAVRWLDERVGLATLAKKNIRKVFPDHWTFLLGEIALWSFVVLLLSGTFLTLWYKPSMAPVEYMGSYAPLRGVEMSDAYASTLHLSFDVRGGLLMRQIHHWAALLFVAAMMVHMLRMLFTGAFRKPREINYLIGSLLLFLGVIEGFTGYSLPDDLLSGTGLRIAEGIMRSTPVVGTYLSFFIFGGEFPGDDFVSRFYIVHVLLIPGLLIALITVHLLLILYHKHTQWPGPGRTEKNVIGPPFMPVYIAKSGGFFFMVFGVITLMSALLQINPIWKYGPYNPAQVTAGSQPDWYLGMNEGAMRIFPPWETQLFGYTISWNVFLPAAILPVALLVFVMLYPFIEQWITGDKREHHLLQRPRNAPTRTAFIVAVMTFYGVLWAAGGNDVIALVFHISLNAITWTLRVAVFVAPVIAFIVTKRICLGLQRADREKALHGYETGIIVRSPSGEYSERHGAISPAEAWKLTQHEPPPMLEPAPREDEHGVANPVSRRRRLREKLSRFMFRDDVRRPTRAELEEAQHHAHEEEHEAVEAGEGDRELPSRR